MLHDVLFALLGYHGDVIILHEDKLLVNPALFSESRPQHTKFQVD